MIFECPYNLFQLHQESNLGTNNMNILKITLLSTVLLFQTACSTSPTFAEHSNELSVHNAEQGRIVNIKQVKLDAEWKTQFTGSLLGLAVGQAIGGDSGGVAGIFIGGDISDELYGQEFDQITIENAQGHQYTALVTLDSFNVKEELLFKLSDGQLVAVSKLSL